MKYEFINHHFDLFENTKILVPVFSNDSYQQSEDYCNILLDNDIKHLEITLRTPNSFDNLTKLIKKFPSLTIGAGSVNTPGKYRGCLDVGAKFLISPGITQIMIDEYTKRPCAYIPGVCTPSDILLATNYDLKYLKFFPAMSFGGAKTLKALSAPFPEVKFAPTGGINPDNIGEFSQLDNVFAIGTSSICDNKLLENKDYSAISDLIQKCLNTIKQAKKD